MKLRRIIKIVTVGAAALFASCKEQAKDVFTDDSKINVVTTTTMLTDMAKNIGGDKVEIHALISYKDDPHEMELSDAASKAFDDADLILYNGVHLEIKIQEGLEARTKKGDNVIAVAGSLGSDIKEVDGETDPHVWGNPKVWVKTIDVALAGFVKADPDNKDYYTKNAKAYKAKILEADAWAEKRVEELKKKLGVEKPVLVTAHDAFQYFADRYGFEEFALQGVSTADDPSLNKTKELIEKVKAKGVKVIFAEATNNAKGIGQVAAKAEISVNNEKLLADACGKPGDERTVNGETYDVGTYIGMLKHNINTIVDALSK